MTYVEHELYQRLRKPEYNPENRNWVVKYQISDKWEEKIFNSESQAWDQYYRAQRTIQYHAEKRQAELRNTSQSKTMEKALYDLKQPEIDIITKQWVVEYPENGQLLKKSFKTEYEAKSFYWKIFNKYVEQYRMIMLAKNSEIKKESR